MQTKTGFWGVAVLIHYLGYPFAPAWALEHLTDQELEKLDAYTSNTLTKEYDDDGNLSFKRQDVYPCRYDQSSADSDVRLACEQIFQNEQDRLLAESFDRYLRAALPFIEESVEFDDPVDGALTVKASGLFDGQTIEDRFCDDGTCSGVVRLEGLVIEDKNGGALNLRSEGRIEKQVINGREVSVIVNRIPEISGVLEVDAVRMGATPGLVDQAGSLGRIQITASGSADVRIYRGED